MSLKECDRLRRLRILTMTRLANGANGLPPGKPQKRRLNRVQKNRCCLPQYPQTSEEVKESFPPQRGGIFVERHLRGSAPQRGAISLLSNRPICFKAAAFS